MLTCNPSNEQRPSPNPSELTELSIYDEKENCYWTPHPLAWLQDCKNGVCNFHYFLPSSFKLAVYLENQDKTYVTQEIERPNFYSTYRVDISRDGTAAIKETTSILQNTNLKNFLFALVLTILFELAITGIYILIKKDKYAGLIKWVLIANIVSLPFVWFIFPLIFSLSLAILLAEIFVLFFEAFIYYKFHKKLNYWRYFGFSVVLNILSFVLAGVLSFILLMFFGRTLL
jgi:hypothetical protein